MSGMGGGKTNLLGASPEALQLIFVVLVQPTGILDVNDSCSPSSRLFCRLPLRAVTKQ